MTMLAPQSAPGPPAQTGACLSCRRGRAGRSLFCRTPILHPRPSTPCETRDGQAPKNLRSQPRRPQPVLFIAVPQPALIAKAAVPDRAVLGRSAMHFFSSHSRRQPLVLAAVESDSDQHLPCRRRRRLRSPPQRPCRRVRRQPPSSPQTPLHLPSAMAGTVGGP
jgi:hypothetical protein